MGASFPAPVQTGPGEHPASYTLSNGFVQGVKRPGRGADPSIHLQCRVLKMRRAIPLLTLRALVAYKGGTFTFTLFTVYISLTVLSIAKVMQQWMVGYLVMEATK